MPILKYRTDIPADKTAAEIQRMLARAGARSVQVDYLAGDPVTIAFRLTTPIGDEAYRLPANVDGVLRVLSRQADAGQVGPRFVTRAHARDVAWRILKDWTAAQLAIIDAGMTTFDEVMLPYMLAPSGQTVHELYAARRLALPAGGTGG
jgi:hypothetical protein